MRQKSEIYIPQREDEHPHPFHVEIPPPPLGLGIQMFLTYDHYDKIRLEIFIVLLNPCELSPCIKQGRLLSAHAREGKKVFLFHHFRSCIA